MMPKRRSRIIEPDNQPDTHINSRYGVRTRREIVSAQEHDGRGRTQPAVNVGDGNVVLGQHVRTINFTGAGVTVTILGSVATVDIP